ncbi:MAG: hypothetical protein IKQ99_01905 [Alphaproteobacteria bacterium]|nr:hypothetical protein [Alphaproteobacteria bacterium]
MTKKIKKFKTPKGDMSLHQFKYPFRNLLLPIGQKLSFIHPDVFSWMAVFVTFVTGLCFYFGAWYPALFLCAIALTLLRMTFNTFDGLLAFIRGDDKRVHGKIINALPDRYGDFFVVGGIALSPLCNHLIGMVGLCSMFLVSYSGMLSKALGFTWQTCGPLDKVQRLVLMMIFALIQWIAFMVNSPFLKIGDFYLSYLEICMILFFVLGQITVVRRVKCLNKEIAVFEKKHK